MMAMPSQMSAQEENGYTKFSVREDFTDNAFQWFRDAQLLCAGGDVANRQATVVHAMRDAKKVAMGIAQYVDAVKLMRAINM